MNNQNDKPQQPKPPELEKIVATHLIGAIRYGSITIRYQDWKPTHVERNESFRLNEMKEE